MLHPSLRIIFDNVFSTFSFYTITAPNSIRPHSDFNITCNFSSNDPNYVYDVQFIISGRDFSNKLAFLKNTAAQIKANEVHSVKIQLGELPIGNYKLKVQGFSDPLIDEEKMLQFKAKTQSTIIQMDKAMYKPGDKVQFRVLAFDAATKPLIIKENLNVFISDSADNRIKQWTKQSVAQGVFKGDLQLSSNPILGRWCLTAVVADGVVRMETFRYPKELLSNLLFFNSGNSQILRRPGICSP
jgi:CD109 antigen